MAHNDGAKMYLDRKNFKLNSESAFQNHFKTVPKLTAREIFVLFYFVLCSTKKIGLKV